MRLSSLKLAVLGVTAAALGTTPTNAQTTSSTPVIGYYKFTAPPGKSMWTCGFVTKNEFQGLAASVVGGATTTVITQTGASWSPNQFQTATGGASSHYVEILTGSFAGTVADIVSNASSSITVEGDYGSTAFTYCVRKHATLGSVFLAAGLAEFEDEVLLFNDVGVSTTYQFDGTAGAEQMVDAITQSVNSNDVPLYPGQGFVLTLTSSKTLTFGGGEVSYVKTTPTRVPLYRNIPNLVGIIDPLVAADPLTAYAANEGHQIGLVGLTTAGLAEYEDEISVFGKSGAVFTRLGTYYYDAALANIVDGDSNEVGASVAIPNGTAFLVKPLASDRAFVQPSFHPTP